MLRRTGQQLGASLARKLEVTLELTQNVLHEQTMTGNLVAR